MSHIFDEPRHYEDERPRKRRTVRNVLFVFLGLFLVAALVAGGYLYNLANTFNNSTQKIESAFPAESTRPSEAADDGAVNIMLMGRDNNNSNADTLMLMHIPADRQNVYVMSIMRDLWTEIPGHGPNKINAALPLGGIPLTVQSVEALLDERIDHVAVVDFEGFKDLTNALGGVTVDVPSTFTSSLPDGETFTAGPMTLDGNSALQFVRERKSFPDGGFQRVVNQQIFVKAVMSEFLSADTLTNPAKIRDVVSKFSPYLKVNEEFDARTVARLAVSLRGVRGSDIELFTMPTNGTGTSPDGQSIVVKDEAAIEAISEAMDDGTLGQYLESNGL